MAEHRRQYGIETCHCIGIIESDATQAPQNCWHAPEATPEHPVQTLGETVYTALVKIRMSQLAAIQLHPESQQGPVEGKVIREG